MRIRFLIMNGYAGGGTVRTTYTLAGALAKQQHNVEIVSVFRHRKRPVLKPPKGVELSGLYNRYAIVHAPETLTPEQQAQVPLLQQLETQPSRLINPADVKYTHFNQATDLLLSEYLTKVRGGVLVGTRPGLNLAIAELVHPGVLRVGQEHMHMDNHSAELQAAIVELYPRLDLVTALTKPDTVAYHDLLGDSVRIAHVPNAVPRIRGFQATPEAKVVIAAGRVTTQKGFDRLVPAFASALEKHPDWELRIFGRTRPQPSHVRRLRQTIEELGVGDRVKIRGFTRQLHAEMAASSIFALSSRREGFPMVLLEAMGCGLAVAAFDCPHGPGDAIVDGVNGLLVPEGDIQALSAALVTLMDDVELRRSYGAAALETSVTYRRRRIAKRFARRLRRAKRAKPPPPPKKAPSRLSALRRRLNRNR